MKVLKGVRGGPLWITCIIWVKGTVARGTARAQVLRRECVWCEDQQGGQCVWSGVRREKSSVR